MKWCALIPARKGSKGIPHKNRALVSGSELIRYTFDAAVTSTRLERVILSTDDEVIIDIARRDYPGVDVPFIRPAELSLDSTRTIEVVAHALDNLEEVPEYIVLLQPTAPLRTGHHIDQAIALLEQDSGNCDSLVSVCRVNEPHPFKMKKITGGRLLPFIEGANSEIPRQELPEAFRLNGAIYIASTTLLRDRRSFFGDTKPYVMKEEDSINIDSPDDLDRVELVLSRR